MRHEPAADGPADWTTRSPALRPGTELIRGADDADLLFVPGRRVYVRLSPRAADLVRALDGDRTVATLVSQQISNPDRQGSPEAVFALLDQLRASGALVSPSAPQTEGVRRARAGARALLHRRWVLVRCVDPLVRPLGRLIAVVPHRLAVGATVVAATLSLGLIVFALTSTHPGQPVRAQTLAFWGLLLLLAESLLHETAHAAVCSALGVPARVAGLTLWLGLIPTLFVDHSDSYRLRSRRARTAIVLAGPLIDLLAAGVLAGLYLQASPWHPLAYGLLSLQLFILATNLNPLLPSDGQHAIEIVLRELNLAAKSVRALRGYLWPRLPSTARSATPGPVSGIGYAVYGLGLVAYPITVAALLAHAVIVAI